MMPATVTGNIDDLVASIEADIEELEERENRGRMEIATMIDGAMADGREHMTQHESKRTDSLFQDIELARAGAKRSRARLEKAKEVQAEERGLAAQSADVRPSGAPVDTRTATFTVGRNQRTYDKGSDPYGQQFLMDVCRSFVYGSTAPAENERI